MRRLVLAFLLTCASLAAAADTIRLDDVVLEYDPARFQVLATASEGATLRCLAPECRDWGDRRAQVHVSVSRYSNRNPVCRPDAGDIDVRSSRREVTQRMEVNGVDFVLGVIPSGCRALASPFISACGRVGNSMLRLSNGGLGCNRDASLPFPLLQELVRGVSRAP